MPVHLQAGGQMMRRNKGNTDGVFWLRGFWTAGKTVLGLWCEGMSSLSVHVGAVSFIPVGCSV